MVTACPFCGARTALPHESQEACIVALQEEIARTREIVERVRQSPDVGSSDEHASNAAKSDD